MIVLAHRLAACLTLVTLASAVASAQPGPTQAELNEAGSTTDWLLTGHDYGGQRFVDLDEITANNVNTLAEQCTYEPGYDGAWYTNPLVRNGVMYLTAGHATIALDATTCEVRWRHYWEPTRQVRFPQQRGVALKDGYAVRGTADGSLIALDAATGALRWEQPAANPAVGESFTMPSTIFEDLVIIGPAGSENGVPGWVGGFHLDTGEQVWTFNTVPEPGEPGAESWGDPGSGHVGGSAVWTPFGLDPELGHVYVPVSNPAPDFWGEVRPGDNLYTGSIVVLDARTGELQWYYQTVPHDVHD